MVILSLAALLSELSGTFEHSPAGKAVLVVFSPLIRGAGALQSATEKIGLAFFEKQEIERENDRLREKLTRTAIKQAELRKRIRILEKASQTILATTQNTDSTYQLLPAHIISFSPHPWTKSLIIDKGSRHGLKKEQTVMNESGIVGVIQEVASHISQVHLIIDQRSAITVRIRESGELGVVHGTGKEDHLVLTTEGLNPRMRRNDHAVTAGLKNSLFPGGILIGTVDKVERDKFGRTRARLEPSVDFNRLDDIFILVGSEQTKETSLDNDH